MSYEITIPPLQKEWDQKKKRKMRAKKMWCKGWDMWYAGDTLKQSAHMTVVEQGRKLCIEANRLISAANKYASRADEIWKLKLEECYGKGYSIKYRQWSKDGDFTCHVNGDVYI